jgi:iron complex outermembrane receptor protein
VHHSSLAATAVALVLFPTILHSAETETAPPLVVTATRLDPETARLPANVTIITAETIARSPARTLPELLALEAGVARRSLYGNLAARDSIDLRGFGATATQNTLILVDGRRLNDVDLSAVDLSAIPLAAIERIEILRGTGAVLYGDGAVGGAINIVTKSAARAGADGSITASSGSYGYRGVQAARRESDGTLAASVHAQAASTHGYRRNNEQEQINLLADFRWFEAEREWFMKLGVDDQNLRLPGVRTVDPGAGIDELSTDRRGTSTPNDYANQNGTSLVFGVSHGLRADALLIVDAGYRRKQQSAFYEAFGGSYLESELSGLSFTPRLKLDHRLLGGSGKAILGVDYIQSDYGSDRATDPATVTAPIHRLSIGQSSLALYGQDTTRYDTGTTLTLGARSQRVKLAARDAFDSAAPGAAFESQAPDLDTRDTAHALELGVRQEIGGRYSLFGRANRAMRFATVDEVFESDPVTFLRVFSPLKPQISRGLDAGAEMRSDMYALTVSAYRMNLENEIHFNPNTFTNDNLDPTRRDGWLLDAQARFAERWRMKLVYANTRSRFREGAFSGNDVPLVPKHTGALSVFWNFDPKATISATARYSGSKRFDNDQSNTFMEIPAYTVVDLGYTQTLGDWKWQAAIQNAFNEKAYDYGVRSLFTPGRYNAYPLPERSYALSLSRQF